MATGRRGGPPDIKGTLGTLLRTTLNQMAALRDVVERQARNQRGWFDSAMLARQRKDVMASLGEVIYQLAVTGELGDLEEFPEVRRLIHDLEDIDAQLEQAESAPHEGRGPRSPREVWGRPPRRDDEVRDDRVWRPVDPDAGSDSEASNPDAEPEPQAVESGGKPARAGSKPAKRRGRRRPAPRDRSSEIDFVETGAPSDDDSDLAEYMHEDDVPKVESGREDD